LLRGSAAGAGPQAEFAAAKVNLTLAVLGRRADGYHELESVVAFASVGDELRLAPDTELQLVVDGPSAQAAGPTDDNLVLKASRALRERVEGLRVGTFTLTKRLPVAAGLGGGSADAAAALRLLARLNGLAPTDGRLFDAAAATGADVPVCLGSVPRVMRGVGEILSDPVALPRLPAVLVNPGVAVATRDVFIALGLTPGEERRSSSDPLPSPRPRAPFFAFLDRQGNDLEAPALAVQPTIAAVLSSLRELDGVRLARMSGSGATCFALFDNAAAARRGAQTLRARQPGWWVEPVMLGGAPR
jgi:4-diphosphocytidyl-2-C-methyl-D-erythritol kinase